MRYFFFLILAAFLIALGFGIAKHLHSGQPADSSLNTTDSSSSNVQVATRVSGSQYPALSDAYRTPGARKYYVNKNFAFAFEMPNNFTVEEYGVGSPDPQVLIKAKDGSNAMLVWMYPVGSDVTGVTADLIKKIDPSFNITSALTPITLDGEQSGASFNTDSTAWTDGTQYWFLHKSVLYRVYTAKTFGAVDTAMLSTWRFTN